MKDDSMTARKDGQKEDPYACKKCGVILFPLDLQFGDGKMCADCIYEEQERRLKAKGE